MNDRIKHLRKEVLQKSQKDFAEDLGLSENFVWMIEKGNRVPSDRTISDICRIFNVNERWLREGTEPKFMPELDDDTDYINELLADSDNPFVGLIKSIMHVYMELSPEDKKKAMAFASSLRDEIKKENRD